MDDLWGKPPYITKTLRVPPVAHCTGRTKRIGYKNIRVAWDTLEPHECDNVFLKHYRQNIAIMFAKAQRTGGVQDRTMWTQELHQIPCVGQCKPCFARFSQQFV